MINFHEFNFIAFYLRLQIFKASKSRLEHPAGAGQKPLKFKFNLNATDRMKRRVIIEL
jgi:hypothetical protein